MDFLGIAKAEPYLRPGDLEGAPRLVTIARVEAQNFGEGPVVILYIEERQDKRVRLTDKMVRTLRQAVEEGRFPQDTNEWGGFKLELHPESFMNKEGEIVPYIRIEVPRVEEVESEPAPVAETPGESSSEKSDAPVTPEPERDATEAELDAAIGEVSEEPAVSELNRKGCA